MSIPARNTTGQAHSRLTVSPLHRFAWDFSNGLDFDITRSERLCRTCKGTTCRYPPLHIHDPNEVLEMMKVVEPRRAESSCISARPVLNAFLLATTLVAGSAVAFAARDERKSSTAAASREEIPSLSPAEVHARLRAGRIVVFDANPPDIFSKHHVPGALRVEYDQVSSTDLPVDKASEIVFYCMNERCGASPVAARRARELGWTQVYLMPAGIQGWIAAGLPVVSKNK